MGRTETFDHTADLGLRVWGSSLADLLESAGRGLFGVIVSDRDAIRDVEVESVALEADSIPDLFLAWLNELIFRSETRHRVYGSFAVNVDAEGRRLEATLHGEPLDPDRHGLDHEVKAATHHALVVEPRDGGWFAEVILDI